MVVMVCNIINVLVRDVVEGQVGVLLIGLIGVVVVMVEMCCVGVLVILVIVVFLVYWVSIEVFYFGLVVIEQVCFVFVFLIEVGEMNSDDLCCVVQVYFEFLLVVFVDLIVLGCIYYFLLVFLLCQLVLELVQIIDLVIGVVC